jgi:hypothetical protein
MSVYLYYYKNEFVAFDHAKSRNSNRLKMIGFQKEQKTETVKLPDGSTKIKNPSTKV